MHDSTHSRRTPGITVERLARAGLPPQGSPEPEPAVMIARPMDFSWPLRVARRLVPVRQGRVVVCAGVAVLAVLWAFRLV